MKEEEEQDDFRGTKEKGRLLNIFWRHDLITGSWEGTHSTREFLSKIPLIAAVYLMPRLSSSMTVCLRLQT